jgi:hypothetical protein
MNRYFYIDIDGKQKGTFSPDELRQEHVKRDTLVWTQGMEQWKRAGEVDELLFLFSDEPGNYQTASSSHPSQYPQPTTPFEAESRPPMPKTWLVESILVTLLPFIFCGSFLSLLGIIGIVYAAQVESFYNRGDYNASLESSRTAGKWTKIALWIAIAWILLIVVSIILFIVFVGSFAGLEELITT